MSSVAVFRRRLAETQRATELPAQSRFNLAASSVDDDTLERAVEPFGAPYGETGFGTSEVFNELLSRDPNYLKVENIKEYQQNLVNTGYAYDVPVDGNWSPYWAASERRASRDAFNTVKAGGNFMSVPVKTVFRYLGYTVPSEVFKGVYGIAQGIVEDFATTVTHPVEVAQEGGLLGGAAVGAGIGAGIGSIVPGAGTAAGAILGGAIGGVAGFFGDLFDDDENEEGTWESILGALTPIDEIKSGDAKNLFAALSTVMTASAILKSGTVALAGVRGATTAASTAAQASGQTALRESFRMAAKGTVAPGLVGTIARTGLKRPVLGGAVAGGVFNSAPELLQGDFGKAFKDFTHGAVAGATLGFGAKRIPGFDKAVAGAIKGIEAAPLMRIVKSPAGQITQALATGVTAPTIVARGIGEMSKAGGSEGTGIARGIDNAPDLGVAGTVLDWTLGAVIYPERLLPWRGKDVANAMKGLASNHELLPVAKAIAASKNIPISKAMVEARDLLGKNHNTGTYDPLLVSVRVTDAQYQAGLDLATDNAMKLAKSVPDDKEKYDLMWQSQRAKIHAEVRAEASDAANLLTSPKAVEIIETMKAEPMKMQNYWLRNIMEGSGPEQAAVHQRAEEFLQSRAAQMTKADDAKPFVTTPAIKDQYLTAQDYERWGGVGEELGAYERLAKAHKDALKALKKAEQEAAETGVPLAANAQPIKAKTDTAAELDAVLVEMKKRNVIDEVQYENLRPGVGEFKTDRDFIARLKESQKLHPREIEELTAELAANGMDRYIAVATGENLVNYSEFSRMAEIQGITEYSKTTAFWDHLSSLGAQTDRMDLGRARYQSIVSTLNKTAADWLEPTMDGKTLTDLIYSGVRRRYDPDYAKQFGEKVEVKRGGRVLRENVETGRKTQELFKIDPRDLTPEDIIKTLDLDSVVKDGKDIYEAAHAIKRAIHVGSAFGADIAHPLATARNLARGLGVNGLPGFNDFMRTTTFIPTRFVIKSDWAKKGSYGYIPQNFRRAHMAIQFSLSPTFDLSRIVEAGAFGKMRGSNIPIKFAASPRKELGKYVEREEFISPLTGQRVTKAGDANREALEFGDKVLHGGHGGAQNFDELQYRMLGPAGLFGYDPRAMERVMAYWEGSRLAARKGAPLDAKDYETIRETVMQMTQYGTKQTVLGNSAHFIFFPFLFSRKQLSAMVDYTLAAPTRNLLVHEGFRRWYKINDDESLSSKFAAYMEEHLPLAKELERINNIAYGVSPGRFFLDGIMDKEDEGKVVQALTSFFIPGGVHQPIADTVGASAEMFKHFFVPQVWVDDGTAGQKQGFLKLAERLIPVYRDLDRWFANEQQSGSEFGLLGAQAKALTSKGSPYTQMSEYLDAKRVMGASLESAAMAAGYSSWESLRSSNPELAAAVNEIDLALGAEFPDGKNLSLTFTNTEEVKDQTIYDINQKETRTSAEEAISTIGVIESQLKAAAAQVGKSQEEVLRMAAPIIRTYALEHTDDRQFMNLWDALFKSYYGPLRQMVAA